MSDEDDASYKRSVKNLTVLLIVVVIVVISGLVFTTYFVPTNGLVKSTYVYDPNGLTLSMKLNTTEAFVPYGVNITLWVNGTSGIEDLNAQNSWVVPPSSLWTPPCEPGWPIGIGIMRGYYDMYNYSSGTLLPLNDSGFRCPPQELPQSFIIEPRGSESIVNLSDSFKRWDLQITLVLANAIFTQGQKAGGLFTVVGADEWGDLTVLHFDAPPNES